MESFNSTSDIDLWQKYKEFEELLHHSNLTLSDLSVLPHISKQQKSIKIAMYVVAMLFAVVGNLLIIFFILCTKGLRTKFNVYVVNRAIADLLIPLTCMWLHLVNNFYPTNWILGAFFCRINTFVQVLVVSVSILTMTVTVLDRFASVVSPRLLLCTQGYPVIVVITIWILATLISFPWILYTKVTQFEFLGNKEVLCKAEFPSMGCKQAYTTIFAVVVFLAPIITMFTLIVLTLRKIPPVSASLLHWRQCNEYVKRTVLNMLFTTLVVFFLCWCPMQCIRLWDVYRIRNTKTSLPPGINTMVFISYYLAYFSAGINPLVYMAFNKYFRHAVRQCFRKKPKRSSISVIPASSETATTSNVSSSDMMSRT